jgi:hypothetical protein
MTKGVEKQISSGPSPDATIFAMGGRLAELERECLEFSFAIGGLSEDEADRRSDEAGKAHSDLEWKLIYTPAVTPEGHREKLRILESGGFCFDLEVLAEILWLLAHEAGRLGLSNTIPNRFKRSLVTTGIPQQ